MPQPQSGSHHHQRYPSTPSVPYYAAGQQQQHTGTQYPLQQYIQQPQQQQQYQYQQLLQQHCQQQQQFQPQPQFQYTQQTPIHKIQNRISQMTVDDFAKEKIVLLLTEMLEAAKAHMERIDPGTGASSAIILGGFLSPSHDLYVGEKLRGEDIVLDSDQRLELCRLQTRDSNWIDVDPWESTQDSFFDFHKVTSRLQRYLTDRCQWMLEQKLDALSYLQQLQPPQQQQQHQQTFSQQQPHLNSKSSSLCHPMVAQGSGSPRQSARNPYKIRVVYLCGADFVLRTGARHLVGGIAVVDRPLGDPASKRRSILLTHNGGSIEVDVSTTMLRSPSQEAEDSESNGPASPTSSTGSMSVRDRVFEQLEDSYGHEWCDASRNNIWWLPSRSRTDSEDISSTRIRNLLAVGKSCKGLLHPLVAQRILEHMIEPESSSAEDH
ncbi:hypothetical protein BGZ83_001776 [Gryganskiella cystojenkinii]|nr:hypothetical protein BGZ83_001776 [Gryganskiella cystojenkinii]